MGRLRPSQNVRIGQYLIEHGSITAAEAIDKFGCYRLSARIYELRKGGMEIERVFWMGWNRYGEPVRFAKYYV